MGHCSLVLDPDLASWRHCKGVDSTDLQHHDGRTQDHGNIGATQPQSPHPHVQDNRAYGDCSVGGGAGQRRGGKLIFGDDHADPGSAAIPTAPPMAISTGPKVSYGYSYGSKPCSNIDMPIVVVI